MGYRAHWTEVRTEESVERHRLKQKVVQRAKTKLTHLHPEEFQRLLEEEWKAALIDGSGCAGTMEP